MFIFFSRRDRFFLLNIMLPSCTGHCPRCALSELYQIMVFKRLFSHLSHFQLGKGIIVQNESWSCILKTKNCFDVSLKAFAFEILQLLGFFLEKRLFALVFGDIVFGESTSWGDLLFLMGFQSEGLEKKLEVLFEKNLSLFEHSFYQHE